jgi:CarD family transcriptional regulator
MFNIGDWAVYPGQGVGVIESIEKKEIMGNDQLFYIMKILGNRMKIMIPVVLEDSVGLRKVIHKDDISNIYKVLHSKDVTIDKRTWNKRHKEYLEKINTGSVFEIASVLRDLLILKPDKNLSFTEKRIMETAKNLLITEISVASNLEEAKIEKDLDKLLTLQ